MAHCRGADEKVEVAYGCSRGPQSAPLLGEYPADFIIQGHDGDTEKEFSQRTLVTIRICGEEHALIELRHGYDAQADPLRH